jgi:succinyl-diaminopimelate desuccinylase
MEHQRTLANALENHREEILAFACDLIGIPSENPPGEHYRECTERIRSELDRLGFPCQVVEVPGFSERPRFNLLAFHGEGRRTVYFHGHYDVVPAQSRDQFVPRTENGRLIGRGAADMKAAVAGMIHAAAAVKERRIPLKGRIGLCIVADEETGGQGGSRYLDEIGLLGRDGFAMLTPEPTGGVVWNANRGAITLRVTVKGRSAHVGLQHQGVNAFELMLDVARALQGLKTEVETRRTGYRTVPEEAARSILMLGGRVEGGTNFNVVPASCSFTVERRFNPEEDLETEKARLVSLLDGFRSRGIDMDVDILQECHSSGVAEDHPVAGALADCIDAVTGSRPDFTMCPGALEIRWYARKGIPAFAYGPGLLDVSHGPNEAVDIESIHQNALVYALAAVRLLS